MPRQRSRFFCRECGYEAGKWLGRCPGCGNWNTFAEAPAPPRGPAPVSGFSSPPEPLVPSGLKEQERLRGHSPELDRVLGGGIVPGSVVLLGGDPGIGKSTLLLQLAAAVSGRYGPVLYVSGEESRPQVEMRMQRLGLAGERLYFTGETDLERIKEYAAQLRPVLLVVDSIQTVFRPDLDLAPGSVGQLRECTLELVRLAKQEGCCCFLVGHVTKDGVLAGPRLLEHMVDVVLYFEGERHQSFRLLRAVKNRFGATNEVAVFALGERGLEDVPNPSGFFLAERPEGVPGTVVVAAVEGTRPLLVEVQALVCATSFGTPRRVATGLDYNRVVLAAAVLEKRAGLRLGNHDVYVSVAGGLRVVEPAADLGIALALASSYRNVPVAPGTVVLGEIGLAGELRSVGQVEQRVKEALRLGFRRLLLPARGLPERDWGPGVEVLGVHTLQEALELGLRD